MAWVERWWSRCATAGAGARRAARVAVMTSLLALLSSCAAAPTSLGAAASESADGDRVSVPAESCAAAGIEPRGASPRAESAVLVTLDGVRWQEVFRGVDPDLARAAGMPEAANVGARELLPNLYRLFFDGGAVLGAPDEGGGIRASGPRFVSLPGYLELMTAERPTCWSNDCDPFVGWTLAEELGSRGPESSTVYASWERVADVFPDARGIAVHAGRVAGDDGPAHPGHGRYQPDRVTARRAIAHLVQARPRFLWVALGDTDEWAHRGDYRGYLDALRFADGFVAELVMHLAEASCYGDRAAVFVTSDHGRDRNFADHGERASADVWLMARGAGVAPRGPVATPTRRHLRDVAPTILALLGMPAQRCPECGVPLEEILGPRGGLVAGQLSE